MSLQQKQYLPPVYHTVAAVVSSMNSYTTYTLLTMVNVVAGSRITHPDNVQSFAPAVARFVLYLSMIRILREVLPVGYKWYQGSPPRWSALDRCKVHLIALVVSLVVCAYAGEGIGGDFLYLFIASHIVRYIELNQPVSTINYGVGMACSFFEGYLVHIIPSDGGNFVGFEENIRAYESSQGILFPVKKLFIVVTKSLYCPPDLKEFNKKDPSLPYIEACRSLADVKKDVAGVKGRKYTNSAYKIIRPGHVPTYLAAECATPLHTLHRVLQKRLLYEELSTIDPSEIVEEFCTTLTKVIAKSPECKGKCELVYYDDTDPTQNLADVLLAAISNIQPNFENVFQR